MDDIRCKFCNRLIAHNYLLKNTQAESDLASRWYHCYCGLLFNLHKTDKKNVFTDEYRKKYAGLKEIDLRYDWYIRNYAPMVEEKTYGRKFLDIGYCLDYVIQGMRKRGWVSTGIDLIPGSLIEADFETYNFKKETYDFIFLGNVLQCFDDPMSALRKAYNLLNPCGLMLIVTPNTDLFRLDKIPAWGHWDMEENRQFLSFGLLEQMIQRVDSTMRGNLKIIYSDDVLSQRFVTLNTMHVLCKKEMIE